MSTETKMLPETAPTYQVIQDYFLDKISTGVLPLGAKLPTEKEIAKQFGTSRATVQNAMLKLVHEGRIEKRVGSGTFVSDVTPSATMQVVGVRSFEDDADTRGERVDYRLLSLQRLTTDGDTAALMDVPTGTILLSFERLRLVEGRVIGLERRILGASCAADISLEDLDHFSTHELVTRYFSDVPARMEASIHAVAVDEETAKLLKIAPGEPLLCRKHRMLSDVGTVILSGEALYCAPFAFRYIASAAAQD